MARSQQTPSRRAAEVRPLQTPRFDRRGFLTLAAAAGSASLVAACGWDGGALVRPRLLSISRVNDWVGEKLLFSPTRLAREYSTAERARSLPSYFISNSTPMLTDPMRWRLVVDGLVRTPLALSLDELRAMPRTGYTVKHHCVEGWTAIASWAGVPVAAIVERCRPTPGARFIMFRSFDADYSNGWDLA
ncbi:MAG: molybdopterin-dependent oxidoreductase, partial [Gemmatimonadales bacterium]